MLGLFVIFVVFKTVVPNSPDVLVVVDRNRRTHNRAQAPFYQVLSGYLNERESFFVIPPVLA